MPDLLLRVNSSDSAVGAFCGKAPKITETVTTKGLPSRNTIAKCPIQSTQACQFRGFPFYFLTTFPFHFYLLADSSLQYSKLVTHYVDYIRVSERKPNSLDPLQSQNDNDKFPAVVITLNNAVSRTGSLHQARAANLAECSRQSLPEFYQHCCFSAEIRYPLYHPFPHTQISGYRIYLGIILRGLTTQIVNPLPASPLR